MGIVKFDQDGSEVCVVATTTPASLEELDGRLQCVMCSITRGRYDVTLPPDEMLAHLHDHQQADYCVPDWVLAEVKAFAADRPTWLPTHSTVREWRAARQLVVEIGQDWPIPQPSWDYSARRRWQNYEESYVRAVQRMKRAAGDPGSYPAELCRDHGGRKRGDGRCLECATSSKSAVEDRRPAPSGRPVPTEEGPDGR